VTEQAGNLSFAGRFDRMRFLTRDRDNKFSAVFDEVFGSEGIRVIHTPIPRAASKRLRPALRPHDPCRAP
jgi:hypothetical protein